MHFLPSLNGDLIIQHSNFTQRGSSFHTLPSLRGLPFQYSWKQLFNFENLTVSTVSGAHFGSELGLMGCLCLSVGCWTLAAGQVGWHLLVWGQGYYGYFTIAVSLPLALRWLASLMLKARTGKSVPGPEAEILKRISAEYTESWRIFWNREISRKKEKIQSTWIVFPVCSEHIISVWKGEGRLCLLFPLF